MLLPLAPLPVVQIGFRERWDPSLFYSACDNLDSLLAISRAANPSLRRVTMKVSQLFVSCGGRGFCAVAHGWQCRGALLRANMAPVHRNCPRCAPAAAVPRGRRGDGGIGYPPDPLRGGGLRAHRAAAGSPGGRRAALGGWRHWAVERCCGGGQLELLESVWRTGP